MGEDVKCTMRVSKYDMDRIGVCATGVSRLA